MTPEEPEDFAAATEISGNAAGGGFPTEVLTTSMAINPPMTGTDGNARAERAQNRGATQSGEAASATDLRYTTTRIQKRLTELAYRPGNTNGGVDKVTVIAITQFRATAGLPKTGKPSVELAEVIAQAINSGDFRAQ